MFNLKKIGFLIIFGLLVICISIITPNFLTAKNIFNLLRQCSVIGIIAIGTTFVIIGGGFDISVGSILAITASMVLKLQVVIPWIIAIPCTIFLGMILGFINGILTVKIKIISLIATFSTMTIIRGLTYLYTGGYPVIGQSENFKYIGSGYIGVIPFPIILLVFLAISGELLLKKTSFGRYTCAIGGSRQVSRLSGISVDFFQISTFVIGGGMAALSGIIYASRLNSVSPLAGQGYELDAIAATVIGGTNISGGKGSIVGSITGVLILSIIGNMFNLLGVQVYIQYVVKGLIILIIVGIDSINKES